MIRLLVGLLLRRRLLSTSLTLAALAGSVVAWRGTSEIARWWDACFVRTSTSATADPATRKLEALQRVVAETATPVAQATAIVERRSAALALQREHLRLATETEVLPLDSVERQDLQERIASGEKELARLMVLKERLCGMSERAGSMLEQLRVQTAPAAVAPTSAVKVRDPDLKQLMELHDSVFLAMRAVDSNLVPAAPVKSRAAGDID